MYNIPKCPEYIYRGCGWKNYIEWVGRRLLSYDDARECVKKLGLKNYSEWRRYTRSGQRPQNIAACPETTYKNKGYKGIRHWIGLED